MSGDINWSNRKLLLHCNGSNGSTTFTDSSDQAQTVSAVGNAALSTTQIKFGSASAALDGSGDALNVSADADLEFGTGDFTYECWVYPTNLAASWIAVFSTNNGTSGPTLYIRTTSGAVLTWYASTTVLTHQTAIVTNAWQHIAVVRQSGVVALYLNGVKSTNTAAWTTSMPTAKPLMLGAATTAAAEAFTGYLDDIRVSNRAEYTATFSSPSSEFPDGQATTEGRLSTPGPLRSPAIFAGQWLARLSAPGPLRQPALVGTQRYGYLQSPGPLASPALVGAQRYARLSTAGPLGAPALVAVQQIGRLSSPSPLGAAALRGSQGFGRLSAAGPLGAARLLATFPVVGQLSAPGPLRHAAILAFSDFTGQVSETSTLSYVADIITPGGTVRVPISSWQATLDTAGSGYVQCVVPACAEWIDTLIAGTEFVISRRATLTNGAAIEYEMARSPIEVRSYAQGPRNYTATISGYPDALTPNASPPTAYDRTLTGVRTVTDGGDGGLRVRADIDWLLRPGMRAYYGATEILVDYINYYVPGNDQYMDIGERA